MRNVCPAILVAFSMLVPNLASAQLSGASSGASGQLSITNYQPVSVVVATPTQWYLTYRADVVNTGPALASVTATVNTTNPYVVRNMQGLSTLDFTNIPANGQVTSSNTFSVLATSTTLDPTKLQWTFQTTPAGPIANAGPSQTGHRRQHRYVERQRFDHPVGCSVLCLEILKQARWKFYGYLELDQRHALLRGGHPWYLRGHAHGEQRYCDQYLECDGYHP